MIECNTHHVLVTRTIAGTDRGPDTSVHASTPSHPSSAWAALEAMGEEARRTGDAR